MRILLAFHSLVTRSQHRLAEEVASLPDVDLTVVAPSRGFEESRVVEQEVWQGRGYRLHVLPLLARRHLHPSLFVYRRGLQRVLRERRYDIVDCYEEPGSLAMAQMLALRRLWAPRSALLFYSAQNILKRYPPPFSTIEGWAYREARHAYVCNSEAIEVLRAKGYRGDLHLLPLGVDSERFSPPVDRTAAQRALGLRAPVVGYVGRLHTEKGVEELIEAFAVLGMPATLLLVGDGPHRAQFEALARARGVSGAVMFTGGVERLRVPDYMQAMDCLVVPSRTTPNWKEQFGRIIPEAFLCGVPVVGSSSGSIPELIATEGRVFSERDVPALRLAIEGTLGDRAATERVVARARARALSTYTWHAVATARARIYDAAVRG